jgi:hypothetical protein
MGRVQEIKAEISKLQRELAVIQGECNHPKSCRKLVQEHENCGMNYNTQEVELQSVTKHWWCGLCDKEWTETVRAE